MVPAKGAKIEGINADGSDRVDMNPSHSDKLSRAGQDAHGPITALWPTLPCGLRWLAPAL